MFCLGDGRTVLHDTEVGELWGHNVKRWPHLIFRRAHQNARDLIRKGQDPLRLICDRAHQYGKQVYPTLLVQQGRGPREEDVRCSDFRFDNAHLEIGAQDDVPADYPGHTCLDFKHQEVRDERFALIAETLEKYPVDGFELQMNYQPYYFHPDEVAAGREIMTEWVRKVHRAVKQSGDQRELAIRIPCSIEGCYAVGMDVEAWLREGLVDALIGQAFSGPELLDSTIDFRPLVAAAQGTGCRVHAALQSHVDSDRLGEASIEMVRGAACNYWAQGVDGLYLAHWFGNWPYQASFYEKLRELPYPEVMAARDKIYYVPTMTGRYPNPTTEPGTTMQLPAYLQRGDKASITLSVSDDLRRWAKVGRDSRSVAAGASDGPHRARPAEILSQWPGVARQSVAQDQRIVPDVSSALSHGIGILVRVSARRQTLAEKGGQHAVGRIGAAGRPSPAGDFCARCRAGYQIPDGAQFSPRPRRGSGAERIVGNMS